MPRVQTVDTSMMAKFLNITPRHLQQLTTDGVFSRARDDDGKELRGRYELVKTNHAYIAYLKARLPAEGATDGYHTAKTQRMAYESEMAGLKLDLMKGKSHRSEDVEFAVTTQITACRARLLAIPARVSRLLVMRKSFKEIYDLIYREIELALRELSGYDKTKFSRQLDTYLDSLSSDDEPGMNGEAKEEA